VQSKIKTKDLANSGERSGSPELIRTKSAEAIKPPSPSVSPAPPANGLPISTHYLFILSNISDVTSAINSTIANNNPQALNGNTGSTPSTNFHVRAASILEALKTGNSISATVTSSGLVRTKSSEGIKPSVITPMVTAAISQSKQGLPPGKHTSQTNGDSIRDSMAPSHLYYGNTYSILTILLALSHQQVQQIAKVSPPTVQPQLNPFTPVHTIQLNKPASPQPIPSAPSQPSSLSTQAAVVATANPTPTLASPVEVQIKSQ
jgi:hypothetical protein